MEKLPRYLFQSLSPSVEEVQFHVGCFQTSAREKIAVGVRSGYIRAVGIQVDTQGSGRSSGSQPITSDEEELFRRLASSSNIYERIARSIAPSIYGSEDIKKAVACLLFGGEIFITNIIFKISL